MKDTNFAQTETLFRCAVMNVLYLMSAFIFLPDTMYDNFRFYRTVRIFKGQKLVTETLID